MSGKDILLPLNRGSGGNFRVILHPNVHKKISAWTHQAVDTNNWEVSGLGTVRKIKNNFYVTEAWLIPPNIAGHAVVEQDPAAIGALIQKLYYGTGVPREMKTDKVSFIGGRDIKNLRFLWHTHANFGVGWSGTDDRTARFDFCSDADWTINVVTNTHGDWLTRMDFPKENSRLLEEARRQPRDRGTALKIKDTTIHNLPLYTKLHYTKAQYAALQKTYDDAHENVMAQAKARRVRIEEVPGVLVD